MSDFMRRKPSSLVFALGIIAYNCLLVPIGSFILVFKWRELIGSMYGYAKYDPITPVMIFLLLALVLEVILAMLLSDIKNRKGILIGLGVSFLLSPAVLLLIWFSLILGNR